MAQIDDDDYFSFFKVQIDNILFVVFGLLYCCESILITIQKGTSRTRPGSRAAVRGVVVVLHSGRVCSVAFSFFVWSVQKRKSVHWTKEPGRGGKWMVASDSLLAVLLASLRSGRGMTRLVSEKAREVEDWHSFVYISGHQGHEGNEVADQLAKRRMQG